MKYAPTAKKATYPRSSRPANPTTMFSPSPRSRKIPTVPRIRDTTGPTRYGRKATITAITHQATIAIPRRLIPPSSEVRRSRGSAAASSAPPAASADAGAGVATGRPYLVGSRIATSRLPTWNLTAAAVSA